MVNHDHVEPSSAADVDTRMSLQMALLLWSAGSVFFPLVYFSLRRILTKFTSHFPNSGEVVTVLAMRFTSSVQAVMASVSGFIAVRSCNTDLIHDRHWIINTYACFAAPYMLYDVFAMCKAYQHETAQLLIPFRMVFIEFLKIHWLMVLHHLSIVFVCLPIVLFLRNQKGDFFIGCMYILEVTTPFLSFRAVLKKIHWHQTFPVLYLLVNIMLLVAFFIFRILNFPFMFWLYGRSVGLSVWQVPGGIPVQCTLVSCIVIALQLYWFYLILQAGSRMLSKMRSSRPIQENHVDNKSY